MREPFCPFGGYRQNGDRLQSFAIAAPLMVLKPPTLAQSQLIQLDLLPSIGFSARLSCTPNLFYERESMEKWASYIVTIVFQPLMYPIRTCPAALLSSFPSSKCLFDHQSVDQQVCLHFISQAVFVHIISLALFLQNIRVKFNVARQHLSRRATLSL